MMKKFISLLFIFFCSFILAHAQNKTVEGFIVDRLDNQPIIGASVVVENTSGSGTITDINGNFSIKVNVGDILKITYIGYHAQSIKITEATTRLDITMLEDTKTFDEVVIIGFGTQKKVNLTGAVTSVDKEALASRPVSQVGQALQGVVPGLNFSQNNQGGALGNRMQMNIRGTGSIGEGSSDSPLVLIDGIEGDMNALNPDDIENISVLKDAAASSVYGSRAPFGVILITTKSGKTGKTQINYSNNFRWNTNINQPRSMDSYTFAQYFNTAAANSGQDPVFLPETIERILAYQRGEISTTTIANPGNGMFEFHQKANDNQDWMKNHFKTGFSQEHNMSVSGGTEKLTYFMSSAITNQDGNLRYGGDTFKRLNVSGKIDAQVTSWMKMGLNTRFIREDIHRPTYASEDDDIGDVGLFYHDIARLWPTMPLYDPNGHYMRNSKIVQMEDGGRYKRRKDANYIQGNILITPLAGWNIQGDVAFKSERVAKDSNVAKIYEWNSDNQQVPLAYNGAYGPGSTYAMTSSRDMDLLTSSIYSDYFRSFGKNNFKLMAGFNSELYKQNYIYLKVDDVISDKTPSPGAAMGKQYTNASKGEWATAGFFGRLNYDYGGIYLLEVNMRYDGSSRFLSDKRWNVFPSFSLGYNIAREKYWESLAPYVGTLKPRVSWGKLGNQNTRSFYPFYASQPLTIKNGNWLLGGEKPTTATAPLLVSSLLSWEKIYTTNVGLDFGALNNRLTGSFEWFKRDTKDMVGPPEEKSSIIGIDLGDLPRINNTSMTTKGWELAVNWNDYIKKFRYTVGFTVSDSRSKVTEYPNASRKLKNGDADMYYTGKYLGDIWGYETIGIAKTDEEMQAHLATTDQSQMGSKWGAGDVMYKDLDGDNKITSGEGTADKPGDMKVIGNSTPRYLMGLNLSGEWNGFDFRIFFQGVAKRDVWVGGNYFWGASGGVWQSVGYKEHGDYFRTADDIMGENINAYFPKPYMDNNNSSKNQKVQSGYLQNGAYLRLKNLQVGYTLPTKLVSQAGLSKVRVFFSADNLFTISDMFGTFDPETVGGAYGAGKLYPLSRTMSCGVNVSF